MRGLGLLLAVAAVFAGGLSLLPNRQVSAANPNLISFQGKVVNSDGTNVTNGTYTFRFRLYTSTAPTDANNACSANTCKWEETKSVTVTNGVFQTELGDTTTMIDVSQYTDLYLGIKFNNDAAGEMSPRVHLDSAPYALNSDKLGGIAASGFVQLGATQSGNINIGTGTITSGNVNGQTISSSANFTGTVTIQGSNALTLGTATTSPGVIVFKTGGANTVTLQGPTSNPTSSYTLKLPTTAPALSQCLQNDGVTIGQLTFGACGAAGGDNITVNGTAATDANFLNTTAAASTTGVTWTLNTGATPNTIAATISNATTSVAGSVTTASQTFAGDKTFQSFAANSATALVVQNQAGAQVLDVSTLDTNLVTNNPGFEVSITGWTAASTTAPTRDTANYYLGIAAGQVASVTTAGEGFKQVLSSTLANGTYTISWYDRIVSGAAFTDVMAGYSATGGAATACTAITTQIVSASGWTRHSCQITAASATASNFITIYQVGASASRTWDIDSVQLESGSTATAYSAGGLMVNATITSPMAIRNTQDSTTAVQIQKANGTSLATVDTLNGGLTFNGSTTIANQNQLRFADADSSNYVAFQAASTVAANVTWTLPSADSAGCLQSNGTGTLSFAACGDTNIQTFSANGTYNLPANALMVIVEAWGGGGGGGGGTGGTTAATRSAGGGGGGGAYNTTTFAATALGTPGTTTIPVTVGAAGTAGTGGTGAVGTAGGGGGATCFSTTTACAGTIYMQTFGGGGGSGASTAGNGGGGGGGVTGAGANSTTATAGSGGLPGGAGAANSGGGGAGGATASITVAGGSPSDTGGGGGGASTTAGGAAGGGGGGSNMGGGGGGGGGSTAVTTCTAQSGGAGGHVPSGGVGGGGTAGVTGGAGGAGAAGVGSGGDGGGGGANTCTSGATAGAGGAGGARGGGGGGGGASENSGTQKGGNGGAGGAGYLRTWTLRGQGADLAEIYCTNDPSLIAGDAVSIDPTLKAGVEKTAGAYDPNAIGIISTDPGLTMGKTEEDCAKPVLVALAGRVPLAVSLENGPIKAGDELTASSTPGVAMKATKAGTVIGQALTDYDGTMPAGYVTAFVQNHESNGTSLQDLIPGLDNNSEIPVSEQALEYLVANKDKAIANNYVSEITTDRVTAGLEIITPSVVTDALTTNTIGSAGGGDISFILNGQNKLVVKGKDGAPGFTVDATGNATFGVSLTSLGDIESKGGLVVDGDALFNGKSTFAQLAQFEGNVSVDGHLTQGKDSGGLATIPKGGTRVTVKFDQPYDSSPIVTASLVADQTLLADGSVEDPTIKEQRLFNAGYSYLISNSAKDSFTIVLNKKADEDLQFTWNAVAIKEPTTSVGAVDPDNSNPPVAAAASTGGQ